jgi:hypothetical protein
MQDSTTASSTTTAPKIRIKNWKQFQHFKDRRPPWIKLYRDLLDNVDWHELPGDDAKALIELWLIASEDFGALPDIRTIAFRMRKSIDEIKRILSRLTSWLDHDDIVSISDRHQDDAPETETETETYREETESRALALPDPIDTEFEEQFWPLYPKKVDRANAKKAFTKVRKRTALDVIMSGLQRYVAAYPSNYGFWKGPVPWLNGERWNDDDPPPQARPKSSGNGSSFLDAGMARIDELNREQVLQ